MIGSCVIFKIKKINFGKFGLQQMEHHKLSSIL